MSPPVYPESAAIIFATEQRVFITPEVPDPLIGEKSLIRAARARYELNDRDIVRYTTPLCNAFIRANPRARELAHPSLESPLDPCQVAGITSVDRVLLVEETSERPYVTTFNRLLGATLFMRSHGPVPLLDALQFAMPEGKVGLERICLPDGSIRLVQSEDLLAVRVIARELQATHREGSIAHSRLQQLCSDIDAVLYIDTPVPETKSKGSIIRGPW